MPRANGARGKVHGALPRIPARGEPPETPAPFPLPTNLSERSSPSRVRSAAQKSRALDRSGPFPTTHLDQGKGANAKANTRCNFSLDTTGLLMEAATARERLPT